jgi:hypothetical protein
MRRIVSHHSEEEDDDAAERTGRFIAILAVGLERFLACAGDTAESAGKSLDYGANLSVTTDCQSNGAIAEGKQW